MFYVYLLQCDNDKSWYIGATSDLKRRLVEHQSGKGGKTTKAKHNWKLIYFKGYLNRDDAFGRERFLKSGGGRKYLKKQLFNFLK
jgi:putative endonuclease